MNSTANNPHDRPAVFGIWQDHMGGKTTDEIMQELRGDD